MRAGLLNVLSLRSEYVLLQPIVIVIIRYRSKVFVRHGVQSQFICRSLSQLDVGPDINLFIGLRGLIFGTSSSLKDEIEKILRLHQV